jgi:hypothetical protein
MMEMYIQKVGNKQKKLRKKYNFVAALKVTDENRRIQNRIR